MNTTLHQLTDLLTDVLPYALGFIALILIFSLADRHGGKDHDRDSKED
ncbi:MAG: hypothetical protein ACF8R9_04400 [Phycisphaerales bacterium JB054]